MKKAIFIIAVFLFLVPAYCFAKTYSVQTATYGLLAKTYALRHFDYMEKFIKDSPGLYVRLLKGKRYLVVRVGDFRSYKEALDFTKKLKSAVKDPFVLENTKENEMLVLKEKGIEKVETVKRKSLKKPFTESVITKPEKSKNSFEERVVYTIEIQTYQKLRQAIKEYKRVEKLLSKEDLKTLRIERHGDHYSLRVGAFSTYGEARGFLKNYKDRLKGLIIQAKYGPKGVVLSYKDTETIEENEDTSQRANQKEVEQIIATVESKLDDEDFGRAATLLRDAVKRWPENPELHALYGETLLNMGFATNAYREYKKAVELSPDVSEYHSGLGYSLLNIHMERAQQAIDAFKKALEIDPENVDALEGLGTVYVSIDRRDLAEEVYQRLKEIDPVSAKRLRDIIDSGLEIGQ